MDEKIKRIEDLAIEKSRKHDEFLGNHSDKEQLLDLSVSINTLYEVLAILKDTSPAIECEYIYTKAHG